MKMSLIPLVGAVSLIISVEHEAAAANGLLSRCISVKFESHDGHEMLGKLVVPKDVAIRAVAVYVQNAEGTTVDMRRGKSAEDAFNYFDLYRSELTTRNIGFFSYEGRGIRMGKQPPRFEKIDWDAFNTGTLENKVKDVRSAINAVRKQPGCASVPIFLIGSSEGSLIAVEAAFANQESVAGVVVYSILASNLREAFTYMITEGAFLQYLQVFDANGDHRISRAEYEAGRKNDRFEAFKQIPFSVFDTNSDDYYTGGEAAARSQPLVDAVNNNEYKVLQAWAKVGAAVAIPTGWFKDHFEHRDIWASLEVLDIPVGVFHGVLDANTPVSAVRVLEARARKKHLDSIEFHYFEGRGHSLGVEEYFRGEPLPEGHQAMLNYIEKKAKRNR